MWVVFSKCREMISSKFKETALRRFRTLKNTPVIDIFLNKQPNRVSKEWRRAATWRYVMLLLCLEEDCRESRSLSEKPWKSMETQSVIAWEARDIQEWNLNGQEAVGKEWDSQSEFQPRLLGESRQRVVENQQRPPVSCGQVVWCWKCWWDCVSLQCVWIDMLCKFTVFFIDVLCEFTLCLNWHV